MTVDPSAVNLALLGTNEDANLWDFGSTPAQDGFSPFNLGTPGYSSFWRSPIDATPELLIDRGPGQPEMAGFAISGLNVRPGVDTVRLTLSALSDFSTQIYQSATEVAINVSRFTSVTPSPRSGWTIAWVFPAIYAPQFIRVEFTITGHPDGYVQAAAVSGSGFALTAYDQQGHEITPATAGPARAAFVPVTQRFPIRAATEAEVVSLESLVSHLRGHRGRVFVVPAARPGSNFFDRAYHAPCVVYGEFTEDLAITRPPGAGARYGSAVLTIAQSTR